MNRNAALTCIAIAVLCILGILVVEHNNDNKSVADRFADGVNDVTDSMTGKTPSEKIGDSVQDVVDEVKK